MTNAEIATDHPLSEWGYLEQLIEQHARVADDIVQVAPHIWAIHGSVPRDGEVIMAEFDQIDIARQVLAQLGPTQVLSVVDSSQRP